MERVYARRRRYPWLVDGTVAAVLLAGVANEYVPAVLPASLALAGTALVRHRFPVSVHNGDWVVAPSTTRRLIGRFLPHLPAPADLPDRPGLAELTAREREELAQVGSGLSNAKIAALLYISEATVKNHVGHIMAKLGLRDRIQVVVYAYETGPFAPRPAGTTKDG